MLVYEKGTGENRHIYGTEANIPAVDDVQLTYRDEDGNKITDLTLDQVYLDDGHGGIKTASGESVAVFIGETNIVPGKSFEKEATGIEVTTNPTKMAYEVGDELDLTGMVVKLFYNDGTSEVVDGWEADPDDGDVLAKDDTPVMITYEDFYDEVAITITEAKNGGEGNGGGK